MNNQQLLRAFKNQTGNTELWRGLTPHLAERLEVAVRDGFRRALWTAWLAAFAAVALLWLTAGSALLSMNQNSGPTATGAGVLALASIGVGWMAQMTVHAALVNSLRCLNWSLQPLSGHSNLCHLVLRALEFPGVVRYRDQVVGTGRQLLVADWECMSKLELAAGSKRLQATTREVCQKVHGIFDVPAVPTH